MEEQRSVSISMASHAVLAVAFGAVSFVLSASLSKYIIIVIGFAIVFALGFSLERFLGKRGLKWWLSNGLFVYIMFWLVSWIFFLNL